MDLTGMNEETYIKYLDEQRALGNKYLIDGLTESEASCTENYKSYDPVWFYGTFAKTLAKDKSEWQIRICGGLVPSFRIKPKAVNERDFIERMKTLGVSDGLIKEYLEEKGGLGPND